MEAILFIPSGSEMLLIFFAVLLLFGGKKIPELMRGLGRGIREFNEAKESVRKSLDEEIKKGNRESQAPKSIEG